MSGFNVGDEVVLTADWRWHKKHDYPDVPTKLRPRKGMVGRVIRDSKNGTTVNFTKATGVERFRTLATDAELLALYVPEEEIEDAIKSILNPNV